MIIYINQSTNQLMNQFLCVVQVKKGLLKWLYPDAHDAAENMGKGLEAYFDKNTGKWVFPGEVRGGGFLCPNNNNHLLSYID